MYQEVELGLAPGWHVHAIQCGHAQVQITDKAEVEWPDQKMGRTCLWLPRRTSTWPVGTSVTRSWIACAAIADHDAGGPSMEAQWGHAFRHAGMTP